MTLLISISDLVNRRKKVVMERKRKGRREERTKEMIRQFPTLRKENKSIQEIADSFGLSKKTVYEYLQEIAENMGVSRDDLLYEGQKPHDVTNATGRKAVEQVDTVQMEHHFAAMIKEVSVWIKCCRKMIKQKGRESDEDRRKNYS